MCWLREQPGQDELIRSCYYDDPLVDAARRFAESEEWEAVKCLAGSPGKVLDVGAGRGIASAAFAGSGWETTALEPDPSEIVGAGAIRSLAEALGVTIEVAETWGESLPFQDETFDVVYGRAVFHHARDLKDFCREGSRVLKTGGTFLMTREHVLSKREDLGAFLETHSLHKLYGGEAAYLLSDYTDAMEAAGLRVKRIIGPKSSPINYFPEKKNAMARALTARMQKRMGSVKGKLASLVPGSLKKEALHWEEKMNAPGRLYTFVAEKRGGG